MKPMHIYVTNKFYLCLVSVSRIVYRTSHILLVVS